MTTETVTEPDTPAASGPPRRLPASVGQRLVWLIDHYRGQDGLLNEPIIWRLRGRLDRPALASAIDRLVARHEALRTTFDARGRRLTQLVHPPRPTPIVCHDLGTSPDPEATLDQVLPGEVRGRLDPAHWPVRVTLWRLADEDHVFCFNIHHLATDDRSNRVLAADLVRLYNEECGGPPLPPAGWPYSTWSMWQQQVLYGESLRRLRTYWDTQLAGIELPRLPRCSGQAGKDVRRLDATGARRLAALSGTSLFSVGLALFYVQLHRATGQRDLAVTSSFINRGRAEVRDTVGFFMNMVVLREKLWLDEPVLALVQRVHATVTDAVAHQDLPHQMLPPAVLRTQRDGTVRVDDVVFDVLDHQTDELTMAGLTLEPVGFELGVGRVPFELALVPSGDEIVALLFWDDRHDPSWAAGFLSDYVALVARAVADPSVTAATLLEA